MADALVARQAALRAGVRRLHRLTRWGAAGVVIAVAGASAAVGELLPGRHAASASAPAVATAPGGGDGAFGEDGSSPVTAAPQGALPAATTGAS